MSSTDLRSYARVPRAAWAIAARLESRRRKARPESYKGACADLFVRLDDAGGALPSNPRYWAARWGWHRQEVVRFLNHLVAAGICEYRGKPGEPGRRIAISKKIVTLVVTARQRRRDRANPDHTSDAGRFVTTVPEVVTAPVTKVPEVDNTSSAPKKGLSIYPANRPAPSGAADDFILAKSGRRTRRLAGEKLAWFREFWEAFAYKRGRAEAADAWLDIPDLTEDLLRTRILPAARAAAAERPGLISRGLTPKMAQGWLSARRFDDYTPAPEHDPVAETRRRYLAR